MSLHPDLAALMPKPQPMTAQPQSYPHRFSDAELTAFALAVARAERERCVDFMGPRQHRSLTPMPDPEWAGTL